MAESIEEISNGLSLSSTMPGIESVLQVTTASVGAPLSTLPLMLSVGISDPSKQVTGSLPPVLPLIRQSGLQTPLSRILSSPVLNIDALNAYNSSRQVPVTFQSNSFSTEQITVNGQIDSFDQTCQQLQAITSQGQPSFSASSNSLSDDSQHQSNILTSSPQNTVSLSDSTLQHSILDANISSQSLSSVSISDNHVTSADINQASSLTEAQNQTLSSLTVQDALAAHLGTADLSRAELLTRQLGELVASSSYLRQTNANQDLNSNQYIISHLPQNTELVNSNNTLSNQQDVTILNKETSPVDPANIANHKADNQIVTIDNSSLSAVGYSAQDYINIQSQLSSYLSEESANHDASAIAASLSNQIEALTNAIKENESGLVNVTGKELPVSTNSSQTLIDNIMVLKNNLPASSLVSTSSLEDNQLQMVISVPPVPSSFLTFCLDCYNGKQEECLLHNTKQPSFILDTPILSRARASLPSCLHLKESGVCKCQGMLGVFTNQRIPCGVRFGPLVGSIQTGGIQNQFLPQTIPQFKVFYNDKVEKIDISDEDFCNWLMFVQPSRSEETQNLTVHQIGSSVYFFSVTDINPADELLYWFSKDYAAYLGYPVKPNPKKMRECVVCGKVFTGRKAFQEHQRVSHHQVFKKKCECTICAMGFSSTAKLQNHMNSHLGVKPHSCRFCGKSFSDQSNLRKHIAIHTAVKKFNCEQCNKQFRQKAHMQTHMLIHSGEKNLKCTYCDKRFTRESDRKQHMYQHTKEKTYECDKCNKVFFKLQNCKRHMLTHGGEKNYVCSKCQKCFYRKYHLQRHVKSCKGGKTTKTEIYLNRHEKCLNLEEVENELQGGPFSVRTHTGEDKALLK